MNLVLSYLDASDRRVASRVEGWRAPRWVRRWMRFASRVGDGWLWLVCVGWMAWREPSRVEAVATAAIAANILLVSLKRVTRRERPVGAPPERFDKYSFPSGHAVNAFAACGLLALAEPYLAAPAVAVAANIAASRVVLGRHYLTDVIAAGGLGILAAMGAHIL